MKSELNNYQIKNPDGLIRDRFSERKASYANDGRRYVKETPLEKQRETAKQPETFDRESTRVSSSHPAERPTANADVQAAADRAFAASSSVSSAASATATAAAATGTVSGAAVTGAATVAATAATGVTAVAGAVAATVATAVIVVAVFVSTLAINLSLLLSGMTSLVFRIEMTGAEDEDFETPIYATISDGNGFFEEQEIFRDSLLLTFSDLIPGTEYTVTVKNEEQIFFEKTYVTATEEVERGTLSAWCEEKRVFVVVDRVVLGSNERFTLIAKDERGNVVFARDGVDEFAEYDFEIDARHNFYFTLYVGNKTAAATELRLLDEPEPPIAFSYDYDSAEWIWEDGFSAASVSFDETHGYDPLILPAEVETEIITPVTCESDGEYVYIARVLCDGNEYSDEKNVTIPATGHDYQPAWEWEMNVDGWYNEDGATLYFVCSHDETHRFKATVATVAEDETQRTEATCEEPAVSVYVATAEYEGKTYTAKESVTWQYSALGHDFAEDPYSLSEEEQAEHIAFTQNENGEIVAAALTLHCVRCDRDVTMNASEIEVMSSGQVNLCEDGGEAEYFLLWNDNGLEFSTYRTVTVGPLGHDYYVPDDFVWDEEEFLSAEMIVYCRNDSEHEQRVPAEIVSEYHAATCEKDAYTLYTATAAFEGVTYTDTREIYDPENPAFGHEYDSDAAVFDWIRDETGAVTAVTVTMTCTTCGHTETRYVDELEPMQTADSPDLCTEGGEVTYYAFLMWEDGYQAFELSDEKTVTVAAQGHDFAEHRFDWEPTGDGGYTANLLLICSRNPDHTETIPATVTKGEGNTYHAEATYGGKTYTDDYTDPTGTGG